MAKRFRIKKRSRLGLLKTGIMALVIGFMGQYLLRYSSAASGPTLFITPPSASVLKDNTFNIELRLDSAGQAVDGVDAYLTYPDAQLQFVSLSESGSAFGIGLPSSGGGGNINVKRLVNPDSSPTVTGPNLLVATITMKARNSLGNAAINYTSQSKVTAPSAGNDNVLVNRQGGNYTVTETPPATTSPPPPPPNSPASNTQTSPNPSSPRTTSITPSSSTSSPSTTIPGPAGQDIILPTLEQAAPNIVTPTSSSETSVSRRSVLPLLLAKIAGGVLLAGSAVLLLRLLLNIKRHHLVTNTGEYSYNDSAANTAPVTDTHLESKVFQSDISSKPQARIDEVPDSIAPSPGSTINPLDNPNDDRKT